MQQKHNLMIVEDSPKLNAMLTEYFKQQSFEVTSVSNGEEACKKIIALKPDIVLLDLMLPGEDGLSVCRKVRHRYSGKIMILTASDDDFDHVSALEIGADDFITKPIKPRVLLARIRNILRHHAKSPTQREAHILDSGQLHLNSSRQSCHFAGEEIILTQSEFKLLWLLASNPDEILSRDRLVLELKGIEYDGLDRSIDNKVMSLRKKLHERMEQRRILTIRGQGYVFSPN